MLGLTAMRWTGSPHSSAAATVPACVVKPTLHTCAGEAGSLRRQRPVQCRAAGGSGGA